MTIALNVILSFVLSLLLLATGTYFWSSIGLGLTLYYFLKVIDGMGKHIPIIDLITTMAALQWVVGPYIDYINEAHHYKYHMYIDEQSYMSFIVPAILAFRIGTLLFKDHSNLDIIGERVSILLNKYPKLPYSLIVIGLLVPYLSRILPSVFGFVFYLLANIKYVGVIYLLFSGKPNRWPIFWITMGFTASASVITGMFHDMLLWAMLTFTFVARELRLSFSRKISIAILGVFFAMTIQSIKAEYRELVWLQGYQGNKITLFIKLAAQQWSSGSIINPSGEEDINVRLNQGWIISAVMKHVPVNVPFAEGKTILNSIESSLIPRFLAPNKQKAGGRENFRQYTGLPIGNQTSMGISIIGEGYANFGRIGGIIFMLVWGIFISWFWNKLWDLSNIYPTILIWSPILFLQVIKAETEFGVVLNHLIKSSLLIFGILWGIKKQYGIRI